MIHESIRYIGLIFPAPTAAKQRKIESLSYVTAADIDEDGLYIDIDARKMDPIAAIAETLGALLAEDI